MQDNNAKTEQQLVVFDLSGEDYGIDIGSVRSIIRMQEITKVPGTPDFVEGVTNLRGSIIPVVDLRKRFGLIAGDQTNESRVVVVDISGQDIGMMVDAVTEVMRIPVSSIEPPSSVITTTDSDYLLGIAKLEDRLVILLDLEKVLSDEVKGMLAETSAASSAKTAAA